MSIPRGYEANHEGGCAAAGGPRRITTLPPPSGALEVPSVLLVGCPEGLTLRVHDAAVAVGAVARLCGVVTLGRAVERYRPLVIAMTEELYGFDPERFSGVARGAGAEIWTLTDAFEECDLAELLAARLADRHTHEARHRVE